MNTHEKGQIGENAAVEYLLSKGYQIEVDIVSTAPDGTLVFVEVKATNNLSRGNPLFKVTQSKRRTIAGMAKWYMYERKIAMRACRVDVIGIYRGKIDHIVNAFWV